MRTPANPRIAALGVAILAVSGIAWGTGAALARPTVLPSNDDVVAELAQPALQEDAVSPSLARDAAADHRLDLASLRRLGTFDRATYFVGENVDSEICLVSELPKEGILASACDDSLSVQQEGLLLEVSGRESSSTQPLTAYLRPDALALVRADGWSHVSKNLVAGYTDAVRGEVIELSRGTGRAHTASIVQP